MAQIWYQPGVDNIQGYFPTWSAGGSPYAIVRGAYQSPEDVLAIVHTLDVPGPGTAMPFFINTINGVDFTNLSGDLDFYLDFNAVGVNSDANVFFGALDDGVSLNGYSVVRSRSSLDFALAIRRFTNGNRVAVNPAAPTFADRSFTRLLMRGGYHQGAYRIKAWYIGEVEPDWDLNVTGEPPPSPGMIGLGRVRAANTNQSFSLDIFGFGIGTDGDPAPTGPVGPGPSGRRRSPLLLTPW